MATNLTIIFEHFALILFCILLFGCNDVDSSDILDCFGERFDSVIRWNISITGQSSIASLTT